MLINAPVGIVVTASIPKVTEDWETIPATDMELGVMADDDNRTVIV